MSESDQFLIIGAGNMGGAIIKGLLSSKKVSASQIKILDHNQARQSYFTDSFGIESLESAPTYFPGAVLLALKPQSLGEESWWLKEIKVEQGWISVVAGVRFATLQKLLNTDQIVRAMPNLSAEICQSITALYSPNEVKKDFQHRATTFFEYIGEVLPVEDEVLLQAATALFGSGPAFVYYLLKSFCQAAKDLGFTDQQAKGAILQLFRGSIENWSRQEFDLSEKIKAVTSPRGTTEAGLRILEEAQVLEKLSNALLAAFSRSEELAKEVEDFVMKGAK